MVLGLIGDIFGGSNSQTTTTEPFAPIQPFIVDTAEEAGRLFNRGLLGGRPRSFGGTTREAIRGTANLARNNQVTQQAQGGLTSLMGAPTTVGPARFGSGVNSDALLDSITADVLPRVQGAFRGGFSESTPFAQAAARAITDAYAPIAYDAQRFNVARDDANTQFNTGVQERDLNRGISTTATALGLAPSVNAMQYGDLNSLMSMGGMRDQRRFDRQNQQVSNVNAAANLFSRLGGLGSTQTQPGPSALQNIGALGQVGVNGALAYSLLCDRRLKRDIQHVGDWRGVPIYLFRYLWDDVLRIGPMADEVPRKAQLNFGGVMGVDLRAI